MSGMVGIRSISTLSLQHLSAPRIFSVLLKTGITFKVNFISYTRKKITLVLITGAKSTTLKHNQSAFRKGFSTQNKLIIRSSRTSDPIV